VGSPIQNIKGPVNIQSLQALACLGLAALFAASPASAAERTGKQVVEAKCASCHKTGLHGAPRIDDRQAWIPRLKQGLDAAVASAIKGHGAMPSRGGMSDLTDNEMRSAVIYLFNPSGPKAAPAAARPLGPNQRIVDGTEINLGLKRVKDGRLHVSVSLRDTSTGKAVTDAKVEASVTNPVMGTDERALERTAVGASVSYDNDFRVSGREAHQVTVRITRPGSTRVIETKFEYKG
jgi:cytochrome c5